MCNAVASLKSLKCSTFLSSAALSSSSAVFHASGLSRKAGRKRPCKSSCVNLTISVTGIGCGGVSSFFKDSPFSLTPRLTHEL